MPTYEYACKDCGEHLEVVQSFKDDALTECPNCHGSLRKVFSAAGIIFKGSGWHVKDYASSSNRAPSSNGGSGDGASGSADGGSDSTSSDTSSGGDTTTKTSGSGSDAGASTGTGGSAKGSKAGSTGSGSSTSSTGAAEKKSA